MTNLLGGFVHRAPHGLRGGGHGQVLHAERVGDRVHHRRGRAGRGGPSPRSGWVSASTPAGGAPIAPASPQPFTPSGLCVQGVSRVSTLKRGTSAARGRQ